MLREEGLGEIQQADDRGGHLAAGGLAELTEDAFQRAEEMEALGSSRLRALLRRLGARGAVHVRELARGLAWRARMDLRRPPRRRGRRGLPQAFLGAREAPRRPTPPLACAPWAARRRTGC